MSEIEGKQNSNDNGTAGAGFSWDSQSYMNQPGAQPQPGTQYGTQPGIQPQFQLQGQFMPGGQGPQSVPGQPPVEKKKSILPLIIALSVVAVVIIGGAVAAALFIFKHTSSGIFGVKEQSLELSETSVVTLTEGEEYTLTIENFDELDKGQNIKWESADDKVITVKDKGDGTAEVTAVAEGKSAVFITGENLDKKKGYVVKFDVEKEPFEYVGKAWETSECVYYFPDEDSLCDFSDYSDRYSYGPFTLTETDANEAPWRITDYVPSNGRFFCFDYTPEREIEYGKENTFCDEYEIWFGLSKKGNLYIYDESTGYTSEASEIDIKDYDKSLSDEASIEAFLDDHTMGMFNYTFGYMNLYGSKFDTNDAFHDNTRLLQCGDTIYTICDDGVYSLPVSSLGTGSGKPTKLKLTDNNVSYFATDGEYIIYAAGDTKSDVDLYIYDPAADADSLLLKGISCMHIAFCDEKIYYTESWDGIECYDLATGNTETIWQDTVGAFWVDWNYVYIYDGCNWLMLDISAGYVNNGYLCRGRSYECDRIYAIEDNILTVGYDYSNQSIALHGVDFAGNEVNLSGEYYGDSSDTYCLACCGTYAYFLAYEGESVVAVDVTRGSSADVYLSDYGLWYANEMSVVDNRVILHVYDSSGDDGYVEVDEYLNIKGIPELPHSIDPNGGSEAAYLF